MVPFTLEAPSRIVFGAGAIEKLPELLQGMGHRILVVSGSGWFEESGLHRRLDGLLQGFDARYVSCATGEPSVESLEEVRERAVKLDPQTIIGIGGGSILDSAKALSALLRHTGRVEEYLEGMVGAKRVEGPVVPWIAVPTTAGTGAEATNNAVVRSRSLGVKRSMRSRLLLASSVIVDPELSTGLPRAVTGISGLDALAQLVEAYVSRMSTPPVRALVRDAFPRHLAALTRLSNKAEDPDARSDASYGALMSGIALANAGLGAAHGFAAGVGGAFDIPHGLLCAVFLPRVLEANTSEISEAIRDLAGFASGVQDPVGWLAGAVRGLLDAFDLPLGLKRYGIPPERIGELAEKSSGSSMRGNPRELCRDEKEALLARVIEEG
jgi:alcohol dehydrogenase class IV